MTTKILFEIQPLFDTGRPPDSIHQSYFASSKVVLTSLSSLVILVKDKLVLVIVASSLQRLQQLIHMQ